MKFYFLFKGRNFCKVAQSEDLVATRAATTSNFVKRKFASRRLTFRGVVSTSENSVHVRKLRSHTYAGKQLLHFCKSSRAASSEPRDKCRDAENQTFFRSIPLAKMTKRMTTNLIGIRRTVFFLFDAWRACVIISTSATGRKGLTRHWRKMGRPIIRSLENTAAIRMDLG